MTKASRFTAFRNRIAPTLSEIKFMLTRLKKSPLSIIGISILIFFGVVAILAPVLAPPVPGTDPYAIPRTEFDWEPRPPSPQHPFGTAEGQYDIYYGTIWGTRTAFRVGVLVVFGCLVIGLSLGIVAGYYGGIIDELLMRFTDIIFAFPGLILAMALVIAIPPRSFLNIGFTTLAIDMNQLDIVLLALVLVGWPGYTRVIRGEVLRVKGEDYVEAAKSVGCSDARVIMKHIVPNAIYPMLIIASLDIGAIVLTAAALSFLGLGAPPGYADWGQMIAFSRNWIWGGRASEAFKYWYTFVIPGLFIFTFTLGWNLLGDAFRDILDPMLRRR